MKPLIVTALISFFSLQSFSQDSIRHECVPRNQRADISAVKIVSSPGTPFRKEFLEVYDKNGLVLNVEVEYVDDMTYIAYANLEANIYFDRDWPTDEMGRGKGRLQLGSWGDPKLKVYDLDCETRN